MSGKPAEHYGADWQNNSRPLVPYSDPCHASAESMNQDWKPFTPDVKGNRGIPPKYSQGAMRSDSQNFHQNPQRFGTRHTHTASDVSPHIPYMPPPPTPPEFR